MLLSQHYLTLVERVPLVNAVSCYATTPWGAVNYFFFNQKAQADRP